MMQTPEVALLSAVHNGPDYFQDGFKNIPIFWPSSAVCRRQFDRLFLSCLLFIPWFSPLVCAEWR